MSEFVKNITMNDFEDTVDRNPIVILDFWAQWCGPCRVFSPIFDQLAELHPEICFGKVDIEEAQDLAAAFQVRSVPTIMAFVKGELVFEQPGLIQPESFAKLIENLKVSAAV